MWLSKCFCCGEKTLFQKRGFMNTPSVCSSSCKKVVAQKGEIQFLIWGFDQVYLRKVFVITKMALKTLDYPTHVGDFEDFLIWLSRYHAQSKTNLSSKLTALEDLAPSQKAFYYE